MKKNLLNIIGYNNIMLYKMISLKEQPWCKPFSKHILVAITRSLWY